MNSRRRWWFGAALVCLPGAVAADGIDGSRAARWFAEFDSLCARDGGALWGTTFCGPILFVDPVTRRVVANQPDSLAVLRQESGVFVGTLPTDQPVANTSIDWAGRHWTQVMWTSLSDRQRPRLRLMGHESFHRMQRPLHLESPGALCSHLDSADGRYWLQLEWNALQAALQADGAARERAAADALCFRAARRAEFPDAGGREAALEIHEGLAEYSGARLAGYTEADVLKLMQAKRQDETGFVRSFAYISGPLYGYLLDGADPAWRQRVVPASDLGEMLASALDGNPGSSARSSGRDGAARGAAETGVTAPSRATTDARATADARNAAETRAPETGAAETGAAAETRTAAETRAAAYGGPALRTAENERARKREAQLAEWKAALVDGPLLILDLHRVTSGSFDPGQVFPFAEGQTVYTVRALSAEWGSLEVDGGAILENTQTGEAHLSLAGASSDLTTGRGWKLQLAPGWRAAPGPRTGDLHIVK